MILSKKSKVEASDKIKMSKNENVIPVRDSELEEHYAKEIENYEAMEELNALAEFPSLSSFGKQNLLSMAHSQKLNNESCISEEVIRLANLSSMSPEEVSERFGHLSSAIRFPYWSLTFDDYRGDCRVRFDIPKIDAKTGKSQRYCQSKGSSTTLFCLPSDVSKIKNINIPLIWTEGEKKHLSIRSQKFSEKYAVISAPGCWGHMSDGHVSEEYDCIPLKNREISFVGDSDFRTNENIFEGYKKLIKYFISKGAIVNLINLGGNDESK